MMRDSTRLGYCFLGLVLVAALGPVGGVRAQDETAATDTTEALEAVEPRALEDIDQCVMCHLDIEELPDDFTEYDIHLQEGLSCAGCHGGDPTSDDEEIAMAPEAGFIGIPSTLDIPVLCAQCHSDPSFMHEYQPRIHTDQLDQYYVSSHGRLQRRGDLKVANCASCHTAHAIVPAGDTRSSVHDDVLPLTCKNCHADAIYMREYDIRTNQFREYQNSVHGRALLDNHDEGAPACNDCHGNHGALPPEISSIGQVCGTCHINNLEFFEDSPMTAAFEEQLLHPCVECHGYHGVTEAFDTFVGTDDASVCMDCHDEGDAGWVAAGAIHSKLDSLTTSLTTALELQTEVIRIGMDDVDIDFLLREARQSLIRARTLVHTFDPDRVGEMTTDGKEKTAEAIALSEAEMANHRDRRVGFGFVSLFITALALGIYLKIREVDRDLPWVSPESSSESGKASDPSPI